MARLGEMYKGYNALTIYHQVQGEYPLIGVRDNETLMTWEAWQQHQCQHTIEAKVQDFKRFLISATASHFDFEEFNDLHSIGILNNSIAVCTPILQDNRRRIGSMHELIEAYKKCINGNDNGDVTVPETLIGSYLGQQILDDLQHTSYTASVFCHNYLNYRSYVLKDNELIGIANWQYAGWYPPQFENILEKYMPFL